MADSIVKYVADGSTTEYSIPAGYMVLNDLFQEANNLKCIVLYSIFMPPMNQERRLEYMLLYKACQFIA